MSYSKINKFFLLAFFLFFNIQQAFTQSDSLRWFPKKGLFPFLEYNLLEEKPYLGVFLLDSDSVDYDGAYIKLFDENYFIPVIHSGVGITINQQTQP